MNLDFEISRVDYLFYHKMEIFPYKTIVKSRSILQDLNFLIVLEEKTTFFKQLSQTYLHIWGNFRRESHNVIYLNLDSSLRKCWKTSPSLKALG